MRFLLFSLTTLPTDQPLLFPAEPLPPVDAIRRAISEAPSCEVRGHLWRIGDVRVHEAANGIVFALGRERRRPHRDYDDRGGSFVVDEEKHYPIAWCCLDLVSQVLAVQHKAELSTDPGVLQARIAALLDGTAAFASGALRTHIAPQLDGHEFQDWLRSVNRIVSLEFTFKPPNPVDIERDFYEPLSRIAEEMHANSGGKAELEGDALDVPGVGAVAEYAAHRGESCKVSAFDSDGQKQSRSIGDEPQVILTSESTPDNGQGSELIRELRAKRREKLRDQDE